jgi:hypothetical protein
MSSPVREGAGPISYAPRWARTPDASGAGENPRNPTPPETEAAQHEAAPIGTETARHSLPPPSSEPPWKRRKSPLFEGDMAIKDLRERLALTPDQIPEPAALPAGRAALGIMVRLLGVLVLIAGGATGVVWIAAPRTAPDLQTATQGQMPLPQRTAMTEPKRDPNTLEANKAAAPRTEANKTEVVKNEAQGANSGAFKPDAFKPEPFKAELFKAVKTERITTEGLKGDREPAATPSAPQAPPAAAPVQPPRVVLPPTETRIAPAAAAPPLNGPPTADREETAALLARGRAHIADGDLVAARLVLRRAVERGDPQAALALGGTFDPNVLKRLGVVSVVGDLEQAREWYRKAADLGSADAPARLEQLAQIGR